MPTPSSCHLCSQNRVFGIKTHTFTSLQQEQCVFVVPARPERERIGPVRGERMAVYGGGHALRGPGGGSTWLVCSGVSGGCKRRPVGLGKLGQIAGFQNSCG